MRTPEGHAFAQNIWERNTTMRGDVSVEEKKQKIMAGINSRGWFITDIYWEEAKELEKEGLIKLSDRYFTGGNRKPVWVKT